MYTGFAYVYDRLVNDIDYSAWCDFIESVFRQNGINPSLMLELGCGTGNFCIELAHRGYQMIGLDLSADMLSCAKQKSLQCGADILFINQDMTDFELYGTVDVVLCLLDSMNYITKKTDLKRMFRLVRNYLNPGGLFIFDVNSVYKFERILADNMFYEIGDDLTYIWQNRYDREKKICEFDLTFFMKKGEYYNRLDETHCERAYSVPELLCLSDSAGFRKLGLFGSLDNKPLSENDERAFIILEKPT